MDVSHGWNFSLAGPTTKNTTLAYWGLALQLASRQSPLETAREIKGSFGISRFLGRANRFLDSGITRMQDLGVVTGHHLQLKEAADQELARRRALTVRDRNIEKVTDQIIMAIIQTPKIDATLAQRLKMIELSTALDGYLASDLVRRFRDCEEPEEMFRLWRAAIIALQPNLDINTKVRRHERVGETESEIDYLQVFPGYDDIPHSELQGK